MRPCCRRRLLRTALTSVSLVQCRRARVMQQRVDADEKVQEAIDTCPVSCIHWVRPLLHCDRACSASAAKGTFC